MGILEFIGEIFSDDKNFLFYLSAIFVSLGIFLIFREVVTWYFKFNKMVKLMEEADKDRKDLLKLMMDYHNEDKIRHKAKVEK